jgi:hypothetical protein
MATKKEQELKHEDVKSWQVLCWGACVPYHPCGIDYLSTEDGEWKRATTGDVVEDISPESVKSNRMVEEGVLAPVEWKRGTAPKAEPVKKEAERG